ncbi:MAG: diguanylate cyclase [Deltaproteobacteria bacterium]|uniref:Diguanylate cyclase n=1 Tax=Candidatus Zymogenus saltonus TaxID=2844893 RepID=A0A9D8KEG6_9DELT|nr:diguanylate cyclase [Candidatus Zymogenus saltonus]
MSDDFSIQKHLEAIRNISESSTKSGGAISVLRAVSKEIVETLGYGRVIIGLKNRNSLVMRFRLGGEIGRDDKDLRKTLQNIPAVTLRPDNDDRLSASAYALLKDTSVIVEDSNRYGFRENETFQDEELIKSLGLKSYIIIPITLGNESIGVIIIDDKYISRKLNDNDIANINAFSDNISVSIVNARKFDILKRSHAKINAVKKELLRSQRMYRLIIERGTDAIFIIQNYRIVFANRMLQKLLGYETKEIIGRDFSDFVSTESKQYLVDSYENAYRKKAQTTQYEYYVIKKDGSKIAIWMTTSLTRYNNQLAILCFARDITEKKKSESELSEAKDYLENIIESANDIIYVLDRSGRFTYLNPKMEEFGYRREDLIGKYFLEVLSNRHRGRRFRKTLREGVRQVYEVEMLESDGKSIRNVVISTSPLFNDKSKIEGVLVVGKDITDRKRVEERLKRLTITDSLTGLYNRRHFFKTLRENLVSARKESFPMCLMMLDIDDFKVFNDTYGHLAGDEVLRTFGKITTKSIRCNVDLAFRYGGDEFAIILPNAKKENAEKIASRITQKFEENFGDLEISIGISSLDNHKSIEELIDTADNAMYAAKSKKKTQIRTHKN